MAPKGISQSGGAKLGTFTGVFTPSILTILGIILFRRLGFVTGSAGLSQALLIILVANIISVLTSFSLSAIATNLKIKGGGDYYVISRTLGIEFGGAIGIVLYLAQSVSIAFYCIGFGEALCEILPPAFAGYTQIIATLAVFFLFIFAWLGADWATKFQFIVMVLLVAALVSFFAGGILKWNSALLYNNWSKPTSGVDFWILFAIFFPAVTGFTQGVSMSGDLKDPGKSLPIGTFLAVGISIIVYFSVAVFFSAALSNNILTNQYNSMQQIAIYSPVIDAGVIAATLSSAMASFLGAPRILQSLSADRIFSFLMPFAQGVGPSNNPRRGVLLSLTIALVTIALGNLNIVASVVSMFFLISYGLLNYATYYEAKANSPSFRPLFRWYHHNLSLLGCLSCLIIILAIDIKIGIIAISILFAVYQYLKRTAGKAGWADSNRSHHLHQVRKHLVAASQDPEHPRDWRPQLLVFSDDSKRRKQILHFASWVAGKSGTATLVHVVEGEGIKFYKQRKETEDKMLVDIQRIDPSIFPLALVTPNLDIGLSHLLQAVGIGPLKINTVLLNWFENFPTELDRWREYRYGRNLRTIFNVGCNTIILAARLDEQLLGNAKEKRIDIWWWDDATSRLMLLLAHLLTQNEAWEDVTIRVIGMNYDEPSPENTDHLRQVLENNRIEAIPYLIEKKNIDGLCACSSDSVLTFVPFRVKNDQLFGLLGNKISELFLSLHQVVLVMAAEDIDLDAEPEEGKASEIAAMIDEFQHAQKKSETAEKEVKKTGEAVAEARAKLQNLMTNKSLSLDEDTRSRIKTEIRKAESEAEKSIRKAGKAAAKLEIAADEAREKGIQMDSSEPEE